MSYSNYEDSNQHDSNARSSNILNSPSTTNSTYEATKARRSTQHHADLIHWDHSKAFRDCPYRQLHHQRGWIGSFRVRLLEAADLQRSYWSALALPAVRHLKLSKAHGAVSAFCNFTLEFEYMHESKQSSAGGGNHPSKTTLSREDLDKKPAARTTTHTTSGKKSSSAYSASSPVVPSDNSPVWDNCEFEFPLRKGVMQDGQRILLKIRVEEDATAVESLFPGANARLLGVGTLDLTELCLGETITGQALPGVRDVWVPISMNGQAEEVEQQQALAYAEAASSSSAAAAYSKDHLEASSTADAPKPPPCTGMVRVLVSYQPHGLEPQVKDVVALEAFARRSPWHNTCRPLLPPLKPLAVLERRGAYLLCEYELAGTATSGHSSSKACVRLHRNAVFVIERQNMMDAAQNLALLPLDVVSATPLGQATGQLLAPVVAASRELAMPALLSARLAWVAARTTGLAGMSGVLAVGNTLWSVGTSSLISSHRGQGHGSVHRHESDDENRQRQREAATAKFVSL
ncbi:hypothetical protein MPSEU_000973700 [Mayamaea pseudoterrestris]|nr:hypothetical protein MPSEU_000973700 [Mayamaea pseudoterrestris]